MSTIKADAVTAVSTDGSITVKGAGSGVVKLGDGELKFPDADGTSGHFIKTDGSAQLSFSAGGGFTLGTEQATTSGSALTFSSIPTGVTRIIISLASISTDNQNTLVVAIGDSGGLETSGYINDVWEFTDGGNTAAQTATTSAFGVMANQAGDAEVFNGQIALALEDSSGFTWTCIGQILGDADYAYWSSGTKSLTAELTQFRLTASGAFDAGAVNIMYQ